MLPAHATRASLHAINMCPLFSCRAMVTLMHCCCGRSDDARLFHLADICPPYVVPTVGPSKFHVLRLILRRGKTQSVSVNDSPLCVLFVPYCHCPCHPCHTALATLACRVLKNSTLFWLATRTQSFVLSGALQLTFGIASHRLLRYRHAGMHTCFVLTLWT